MALFWVHIDVVKHLLAGHSYSVLILGLLEKHVVFPSVTDMRRRVPISVCALKMLSITFHHKMWHYSSHLKLHLRHSSAVVYLPF